MAMKIVASILAAGIVTCVTAFEDCSFTAKLDGTEQRYLLSAPKDASGPVDVLVSLHGHGSDRTQIREERGECKAARDVAAERGMALVSPDYRAKTSWMGPAAEADMLQLLDILSKRFGGRIFLCGGSMGGTSALTFAARHPEKVSGVTAFNPLANHLSYDRFQDAIAASFGGAKRAKEEEYRARSALFFPERFTMPLSITLGGQDTTVPPASARELAASVAALHPENVYVDDKPDRGHATDYAASVAALREMFRRADACRVTFRGQAVQPSFGSVAGIWFWSCGDAQLLLLGFEGKTGWRSVACGAGWEINGKALPESTRTAGLSCCRPLAVAALAPVRAPFDAGPVKGSPPLAPAIADALVEWDWRLQDGIGTPREPRTFAEAVVPLRARFRKAGLGAPPKETADETEWRALHQALRAHALKRLEGQRLFFGKFVPGRMSHQLTQCLGHRARPGGGLFVLDDPATMRPREVTPPNLPAGSFLNPELSPDATKVLFSYSPVGSGHDSAYSGGTPQPCSYTRMPVEVTNVYSIYEAPLAGGPARRLTSDGFDDLFPIYLPGGDVVFSSARRGGYHRCGGGPCPVFTLARMGPNGENPHSISFHETHEWTPALLPDGRLLYTRWDYVDRNAVLYQQLWTARPDGGGVRIYYGNNTWNPCGTWEARPVPGSTKVMAIAGPHHGMSAGSVVLVDTLKGIDGEPPIRRLTPEVRFPESEEPLAYAPRKLEDIAFDYVPHKYWRGGIPDPNRNLVPTVQEKRWPGHSFKSPWPLSETTFLASYSYDRLMGEPGGNTPNQYGIYLCDADGGRELIYRDPRISSLWARPVEPRALPPLAHSSIDGALAKRGAGTFALGNVTEAWPTAFPTNRPITALRIFHIINKTTPHIDKPKVGAGLGSVGREVLGTVPVEADGSAYFEVPARMPVYFQALDREGRAVQTMRSLVYLQPGERESCLGCHEDRRKSASVPTQARALQRPPSRIAPEVSGSRPFNFLKLVQPVLDAKCVKCHDGTRPKCPSLKGEPEGWACKSFNALVKHVAYSSWGAPKNNYEPLTEPLRFGALASPLLRRIESKHGGVKLTDDELHRLILWMDSNGACWGTFDKDKQRDL